MIIWTIPNALSFARLLGVPVFYYLIAIKNAYGIALIILVVSGFTDWLDGYLARKLQQFSRLGELMDPLADRLYVLAAIIALYVQEIIPLVVLVLLLTRDVVLTILLAYLKRFGFTGLPVHFVGKAATMNLLYAMPLMLLSTFEGLIGQLACAFGWAFLIWGITMYWFGALLYVRQVMSLDLKSSRQS